MRARASILAGTTGATAKISHGHAYADGCYSTMCGFSGNEATSEKGLALSIHCSFPICRLAASTTTCPLNRCHVNHVVDGTPLTMGLTKSRPVPGSTACRTKCWNNAVYEV